MPTPEVPAAGLAAEGPYPRLKYFWLQLWEIRGAGDMVRRLTQPMLAGLLGFKERHLRDLLAEASAYLEHPILGARLRDCVRATLSIQGRSARQIFGGPDDLKFRSSLTLFRAAAPQDPLFQAALDRYFAGEPDAATLALLTGRGAE